MNYLYLSKFFETVCAVQKKRMFPQTTKICAKDLLERKLVKKLQRYKKIAQKVSKRKLPSETGRAGRREKVIRNLFVPQEQRIRSKGKEKIGIGKGGESTLINWNDTILIGLQELINEK